MKDIYDILEWNPEWDKLKKAWIPRPPKGHADERALADRYSLRNSDDGVEWLLLTRI